MFTLPCSTLQWIALATFGPLLLNFLGYFDDAELRQYRVLRGPGRALVLLGRLAHFLFAGYSKLTDASNERPLGSLAAIPGFLIIYGGGLALSAYCCGVYADELAHLAAGGSFWDVSTAALLALMSLVHYAKRCIEVLFVHHYTDTSRVETICALSICGWYVSNVLVTIWLAEQAHACGGPPAGRAIRLTGTGLWILGEASNGYHHLLLRWLRTRDRQPARPGASKYKLPVGGLFAYVAAPHYFFELVNWLGVSLLCGHSVVWVMHGCNMTYLAGRAVQTTRFYRKKIDNYPKDRKHIFPLIF